jgi:hypothetical protein
LPAQLERALSLGERQLTNVDVELIGARHPPTRLVHEQARRRLGDLDQARRPSRIASERVRGQSIVDIAEVRIFVSAMRGIKAG